MCEVKTSSLTTLCRTVVCEASFAFKRHGATGHHDRPCAPSAEKETCSLDFIAAQPLKWSTGYQKNDGLTTNAPRNLNVTSSKKTPGDPTKLLCYDILGVDAYCRKGSPVQKNVS